MIKIKFRIVNHSPSYNEFVSGLWDFHICNVMSLRVCLYC